VIFAHPTNSKADWETHLHEQIPAYGIKLKYWENGMSKFMALLVEDDTLQREALANILKDDGFEVIECGTAEAAELIIATSGTELQALVTDNHLDGVMSGIELARYALQRFPKLNVIIMSGREVHALPVNTQFLRKPFTADRLLDAVR
jgi:DNA-binding NtrC family response regulator